MPRLVKAGLNIIIDISFRTIALQLSRGLISFNWSIELNKLRQTAFSNSLCHGCRNGTRALIFLARMEQERSARANISSRAKNIRLSHYHLAHFIAETTAGSQRKFTCKWLIVFFETLSAESERSRLCFLSKYFSSVCPSIQIYHRQ